MMLWIPPPPLQVLVCVTQALEVEGEPEVRRAAVLVVKTILSDLGQDAVQVSAPPSPAVAVLLQCAQVLSPMSIAAAPRRAEGCVSAAEAHRVH